MGSGRHVPRGVTQHNALCSAIHVIAPYQPSQVNWAVSTGSNRSGSITGHNRLRAKTTGVPPDQPTGIGPSHTGQNYIARGGTVRNGTDLLGQAYQSAHNIFGSHSAGSPAMKNGTCIDIPYQSAYITLSDNFSAKHRARFYVAIFRHSYQAADISTILTVNFYIRHLTTGNRTALGSSDQSAYTLPLKHLEFRRFNPDILYLRRHGVAH